MPQCAVTWQTVVTETVVEEQITQEVTPTESQSDVDYRQLNTYADEFYHINLNDRLASGKLKKLGKNVEAFRKSLLGKNYNAMDVLKDAEELKARIAAQRAALAKGKAAPPPKSLPPGSTVIFPPQ